MSQSVSPQVDNFLSRLNGVRKNGNNWSARCPCRNDDENPSLSIGQGDDGRVLATCHRGAGCSIDEICTAMNMSITELYPPKKEKPSKKKLVKVYKYQDADGNLIYEKLRYIDEYGKKSFGQRRPDPSNPREYIYNLDGVTKLLYNLPAVTKAVADGEPVWLVEGEKDADTLIEQGIIATTPPNGAGKWEAQFTQVLAGAYIELIADNDEVGLSHAWDVAERLSAAGSVCRVWRSPKHKDISDHLGAGLSFDDLELLESRPIVVKFEETPMGLLLDQIKDIFQNENLDEQQKLNRASMALNATNVERPLDTGRLVVWEEFLQEAEKDSYEWIIPDMLEVGERVIVVASEGVGKTMLARQVALCSAAGIHPFTYQRMNPIRTLTIDLENPERIIRRTSRNILNAALGRGYAKSVDAHLLIKPSGLDLTKAQDRALVEEAIERVQPQLICLGPLYKAFEDNGTRTSEALAVEVAKYLDMIRDTYKCALWLEHHAPLGTSGHSRELRPFGSAVWSRWPEFGLALQPDPTAGEGYVYEVRHFRGARDKRPWPLRMKRGKIFPFEVIEFAKVE